MLRRLNDMPARAGGFAAFGEVDADDIEGDAIKADTGFRPRHAKELRACCRGDDESWIKRPS